LDDEELGKIEDALFEEWHWVQLRARRLDLKQGVHTLTITNREDGAAFDQILLVRDADDWPTGIEKAGVAGRTSGVTASPTKAEPPAGEAADVAEK
jgi:hypothetical protein